MYKTEIDFDADLGMRFSGVHFSDQTKQAINNYLLSGWMPGGHLEAQFAHDLERALYNADTHNRVVFWAIAMWIREHAPDECQGSYAAVQAYCANKEAQEQFRQECEKKYMWKKLESA
jgi:hypothetical protein